MRGARSLFLLSIYTYVRCVCRLSAAFGSTETRHERESERERESKTCWNGCVRSVPCALYMCHQRQRDQRGYVLDAPLCAWLSYTYNRRFCLRLRTSLLTSPPRRLVFLSQALEVPVFFFPLHAWRGAPVPSLDSGGVESSTSPPHTRLPFFFCGCVGESGSFVVHLLDEKCCPFRLAIHIIHADRTARGGLLPCNARRNFELALQTLAAVLSQPPNPSSRKRRACTRRQHRSCLWELESFASFFFFESFR